MSSVAKAPWTGGLFLRPWGCTVPSVIGCCWPQLVVLDLRMSALVGQRNNPRSRC